MNALMSMSRWLFAIPFAVLGLLHFFDAQTLSETMVPDYLPFKLVWVYFFGFYIVVCSVFILIGKYDKLAAVMIAFFLLLTVFTVHFPRSFNSDHAALTHLLKDFSLAGAALMYAVHYARDATFFR